MAVALQLTTPIEQVKGVGERLGGQLRTRGVEAVEDLLYHLPFRYEDRLSPKPLAAMQAGEMASLVGEVRGSSLLRTRGGSGLFEMTLGLPAARDTMLDSLAESTIKCIWFNGSYLRERFPLGRRVAVFGKLEPSRSGAAGRFKLIQPQFELLPESRTEPLPPGVEAGSEAGLEAGLETARLVPVYESLGGTTPWGAKLTSKWTRRLMWNVFAELRTGGLAADAAETLPRAFRERLGFPSRLRALEAAHFPAADTVLAELEARVTPAQRRLIFEEFWYLELGLELKRRRLRERAGVRFETGPAVREALKQVLPFHPTAAQKRVLAEIAGDMRRGQPMRRLLQGDVGSGKTIVAMQAAVVAIENGFQAALMAPTEILATQHFLSARKLLGEKISPATGRPYRVTLLTGSLDDAAKREGRGRIARGETQLAIGTHALLSESVDFARLGLVVVDEQHRFGVQQRAKLMRKPGSDGESGEPDVLVMTATPIPRTLALTIYGDMDLSVIDELPPGRTPIVTRRTTEEKAAAVWEFVRKQVALGRQAYLVYPVIEGAQDDQPELDFARDVLPADAAGRAPKKSRLRSATAMYDELRAGALAGLRLGLLHGRMSADHKETAMRRFARGETDVLVATTVIEVGVDVPNASVMVIEHAERFGLAQMHQLRGRVGRGAAKSFCILMTGSKPSGAAEARLDAMVRTQNGFELAELDLKQRGPGEFFGTRQAGLPEFRVADLLRDREMLELAKQEAARFVERPDPTLTREEIAAVWARLKAQWQRRYGLLEA